MGLLASQSEVFLGNDPHSYFAIINGAMLSIFKGVVFDLVKPEQKQWDQMAANVVGTGIYVIGMLALFHGK